MSQNRLFKVLVTSNWLLQLLMYVLPFSSWYSDPRIGKMMIIDGYDAMFAWGNPLIYQIPLWGFLIASIGMLYYQNWARYLYLALWLYGWIATLMFGVRVSLPAEGFIGMAIGTIDGMVLYLVFLSDLRLGFRRAPGAA